MRGQVVVDWDLEKLMKEYDNGERLTAEEESKLELDLAEYMHEFKLKELDAEIEKLNVKVEEMTRKAEEDDVERKQRNEEINMLRRKLEGSGEDVERAVMRREEASLSGSRVSRRSRVRCWDLTRPGGCQYGVRCRYLHPGQVEEEEVSQRQQGFLHSLAMVRGVRGAMVGGNVASLQLLQQQQMSQQMRMWPLNQQRTMTNTQYPASWNQMMMSQPNMMSQQKVMVGPMVVYGRQGWSVTQ